MNALFQCTRLLGFQLNFPAFLPTFSLSGEITREGAPWNSITTRLGELLVHKGYITPGQLGKACEAQQQHDGPLGAHLINLGCLTEEALLAYSQKEYRLATVDPLDIAIPEEVVQLVPPALAKKYHLLPVELIGSTLTIAVTDPSNLVAVDDIKFLTG